MRGSRSTVQAILTPGGPTFTGGARATTLALPAVAPSTLAVTSLSGGVTTYDAARRRPMLNTRLANSLLVECRAGCSRNVT